MGNSSTVNGELNPMKKNRVFTPKFAAAVRRMQDSESPSALDRPPTRSTATLVKHGNETGDAWNGTR